jgi:hypothetical protein
MEIDRIVNKNSPQEYEKQSKLDIMGDMDNHLARVAVKYLLQVLDHGKNVASIPKTPNKIHPRKTNTNAQSLTKDD